MAFELHATEEASPKSLSPGFFYVDLSGITAQQITDWITPGAKWENHEDPSSLPRSVQDLIDLWHSANVVKVTGQKYCLYISAMPTSLKSRFAAYVAIKFRYLGDTWSSAKTAFSDNTTWNVFWPKGFMDPIIFGWKGSATV